MEDDRGCCLRLLLLGAPIAEAVPTMAEAAAAAASSSAATANEGPDADGLAVVKMMRSEITADERKVC